VTTSDKGVQCAGLKTDTSSSLVELEAV